MPLNINNMINLNDLTPTCFKTLNNNNFAARFEYKNEVVNIYFNDFLEVIGIDDWGYQVYSDIVSESVLGDTDYEHVVKQYDIDCALRGAITQGDVDFSRLWGVSIKDVKASNGYKRLLPSINTCDITESLLYSQLAASFLQMAKETEKHHIATVGSSAVGYTYWIQRDAAWAAMENTILLHSRMCDKQQIQVKFVVGYNEPKGERFLYSENIWVK